MAVNQFEAKIIRAANRHRVDAGWLDARWSFSFGDYYDAENISFGPLRVFNEDRILPSTGFPRHPHRDMEIITLVLSGQLEHWDNAGHSGVISAGDVQVITAGNGIRHSEKNPSDSDSVHLLQMWVEPDEKGYTPSYSQHHFDLETKNELLTLVDDALVPTAQQASPLVIHQRARLIYGHLDLGVTETYQATGSHIHIFVISGELSIQDGRSNYLLEPGDAARIQQANLIYLVAPGGSQFIIWDL